MTTPGKIGKLNFFLYTNLLAFPSLLPNTSTQLPLSLSRESADFVIGDGRIEEW